jgi:hypothetical protein
MESLKMNDERLKATITVNNTVNNTEQRPIGINSLAFVESD